MFCMIFKSKQLKGASSGHWVILMSKKHFQTAKWHVELSQWYHNGNEICGNRSKVGLEVISPNPFCSVFGRPSFARQ